MKLKIFLMAMIFLLCGCATNPLLDLARESKCITEVATKESKFTCEFEGKKVFAKK
jgi:starvation-inducible outer membrane lipoprotein